MRFRAQTDLDCEIAGRGLPRGAGYSRLQSDFDLLVDCQIATNANNQSDCQVSFTVHLFCGSFAVQGSNPKVIVRLLGVGLGFRV